MAENINYYPPIEGVPMAFPYAFRLNDKKGRPNREALFIEANEWCLEKFGQDDQTRWRTERNTTFSFRDMTDAMEFRFRWC